MTGIGGTVSEPEETPEQRRERYRSLTLGGRRVNARRPAGPYVPRPMQDPSWEKGKVYEERPGGFRVPLVHEHSPSQPITQKQYANRRHHYEQARDRLRHDPTVFREER